MLGCKTLFGVPCWGGRPPEEREELRTGTSEACPMVGKVLPFIEWGREGGRREGGEKGESKEKKGKGREGEEVRGKECVVDDEERREEGRE